MASSAQSHHGAAGDQRHERTGSHDLSIYDLNPVFGPVGRRGAPNRPAALKANLAIGVSSQVRGPQDRLGNEKTVIESGA